MHWGLTAFERKRIERIASDHPYFDMHAPLLTKKELRTILIQGPRKTGSQVVAEVREELGICHCPNLQERRSFTEALRDAFFVPSFRRTVVLAALSLLLVLFMTLTVPGRAFAEELYSIIIDFANGSLNILNANPSEPQHDWNFSSIPNDMDSPEAFAAGLDYSIVFTNDELLSFRYAPIDNNSLLIRSKYQDERGRTYIIEQELYRDEAVWGFGAKNYHDTTEVQASIGITMYGGISDDGTNILTGVIPQSTIQLSSKQMALAELIQITQKLQYVPLE